MENREIFVANTKTQKKVKITTDATTLGELKAALNANGVDYAGMEFTEGLSRTILLDDNTPLPKDVMFKGQPTNNLVILLTNTKKNIASGAGTRKEAYAVIKENNLQSDIKEEFGYDYTHISTTELWEFIDGAVDVDEPDVPACGEEAKEQKPISTVALSFYDLVKLLVKGELVDENDVRILVELLTELADRMEEEHAVQFGNVTLSKEELEQMMNL